MFILFEIYPAKALPRQTILNLKQMSAAGLVGLSD